MRPHRDDPVVTGSGTLVAIRTRSTAETEQFHPAQFHLVLKYDIISLNARQRRTLEAVFAEPAPADLTWSQIESLLRALGARVSEGRGSRVRVVLRERVAVFHRPHPRPEASRGMIRSVRRFLESAGVTP